MSFSLVRTGDECLVLERVGNVIVEVGAVSIFTAARIGFAVIVLREVGEAMFN
ncbi:hypothetical protein OB919_09915 [Halobacteria archaeon AArc-curdl1]|uniref:Uncharacterized protein n=1 Tax=Natronosalvus hydrolyticus TaxID=2979988 RepID=A0AAP2ZAA0_9EURY|nr:hypothetical protein [Halobacteria archaeon AArc-curdl1]